MPGQRPEISTERLAGLYRELGTLRAVAQAVDMSPEGVRLRLREYEGLTARKGKQRNAAAALSDAEIAAIYTEERSVVRTAQRIGCGRNTAADRLAAAGVTVRQGRPPMETSLTGRIVAYLAEVGPPARSARHILDAVMERGYTTTSTAPINVAHVALDREARRPHGRIRKDGNRWGLRAWDSDDSEAPEAAPPIVERKQPTPEPPPLGRWQRLSAALRGYRARRTATKIDAADEASSKETT